SHPPPVDRPTYGVLSSKVPSSTSGFRMVSGNIFARTHYIRVILLSEEGASHP
ncbi:MAG: hypothetical protein ACI841_003512, partial [Planctomycetota bacterium]